MESVATSRVQPRSRADLIKEAETYDWFHSIEFGDYVSPDRFGGRAAPNATLQPVWEFLRHIDVQGRDCLDLGTADGIVAFTLKKMGARRVVATDGKARRQFSIARELLGLDVEYIDNLWDVDIGKRFEPRSFDLIVMAGFLYHLFSPLQAIAACRQLLRPEGLLITETCYTGGSAPTLTLNTEVEPPLTSQYTTYWIATPAAVEGMMKLVSFNVLGSASLGPLLKNGGIGRIGHIARAVATDAVADRKPQLVLTHSKLSPAAYPGKDPRSSATPIAYGGPRQHVEIVPNRHPDWVPLIPTKERMTGAVSARAKVS